MNQYFKPNGGDIPRSQLSTNELDRIAQQMGSDASNTPKSAVARMMLNLSSNIDDMRAKNQGSPDGFSEDLDQYGAAAKNIAYKINIEEARKRESARLARIQAFAAKQQIRQKSDDPVEQVVQKQTKQLTASTRPTITDDGIVNYAPSIEDSQNSIEEVKHYFDSKFAEVNDNLKAISNLLYQLLSAKAWQEEWQLSDISNEEFSDITDSDEIIQTISESSQQD